ncbi:hypothetical protein [Micromonospora sp. NPDC051296]|uniref:hypothetical protein n=1 Tax=Micromonospora sp. NPDC051296 TaxID=3155046 RepID=UPI003413426C
MSRTKLTWIVLVRHGITEAAGAASGLPGPLGAEVLDAARAAFTAGLTTVAAVGAAAFVGIAVVVAIAFRHISPIDETAETADDAAPARI